MAIANNKDLTHIVRTTQQWESSYDAYECIPEGVLCIEFTPSGQALAKIGNGRDIFSKLPYIGGNAELTNYYTKQETAQCVQDILKAQRVIRIKAILNDKSQLPSNAECGDLYFVISQSQSSSNKYDEYVYSMNNSWEPLGSIPIDIDLSEYAKTTYVDQKIEEVNTKIDEIEQQGNHTHANKDILDLITAAYTVEEKDKLSTLQNYDDSELREMMSQASHTHSNKEILDAISAPFTKEDKSKLDKLNPYDDSVLEEKVTELARVAHEHSNQRILDRTTASFTTEYERKMRWIRLYTGCTGMEEGIAGIVPAAQAGEEDYVLSGSGEWVPQTGGGGTYTLPIATASTLGGIKVGDGLTIDENGVLSANVGDGLQINQDGEVEIDPSIIPEVVEYNAGDAIDISPTGTDLPSGYADISYIESTGSQWTQLNYYANNNSRAVVDYVVPNSVSTTGDTAIFGSGAGSSQAFVFWDDQLENNQKGGFVYGSNSWSSSTDANRGRNFNKNKGEHTILDCSVNGCFIDNNLLHNITPTGTFDSTVALGIFASATGNQTYHYNIAPFRIYSFKIYENNTLEVDLRPALRLSDNKPGFYDIINDDFYLSLTSTEFVYDSSSIDIHDDVFINVKYNRGLTLNQNNELEVNVGDGLSIDPNTGAINVTGGGGGSSYTAGDGIDIDQNNEISVKIGDRLHLNENDELSADPYYAGDGISIAPMGLPTEYTRVRALSSTLNGNQYIDTDYRINQNTVIDMKCTLHKRNASVWVFPFGSRNSTASTAGTDCFMFATSWNSGAPYNNNATPSLWAGGTAANCPEDKIDLFYEDIIDFHMTNSSVVCTNTRTNDIITLTAVAPSGTQVRDLYLFATNDQGTANFYGAMDLYSFKISESGTTIHEYIPCKRNSDNKYGVYDTVDEEFKLSPNTNAFSYLSGDPVSDTPIMERIALLPATTDTIGGIKIGQGLAIDQEGYVSAVEYSAGYGIELIQDTGTGFKVRHNEYYFDYNVSCQIDGSYGPRTFTRTSLREPCLFAIVKITASSQIWTNPVCIGLTADSCKCSNSYDGTILGPNTSFNYKGYTWYIMCDYGLTNSTGVDLLGNVPGPIDLTSIDVTGGTNIDQVGKAIIDLAGLIAYRESMDVWNSGTGWRNGDYYSGTSDTFTTSWYYTYHYDPTQYIRVPAGATKMRVIGVSTDNGAYFEGGGANGFNDAKHHTNWIGCTTATGEWTDIPEGVVYVQPNVKWNNNNTRTISSTDIQSVTLEFWYADPTGNTINVKCGDGLNVNTNNELEAYLGNGLEFDTNYAIQAKLGDGLLFDANGGIKAKLGNGLGFDTLGAIKVTSAGGTDFVPGNGLEMVQEGYFDQLPLGTYSHCDYVENTNDAYCQINYIPPQNVRVTCKFSPVQTLSDGPVFGSRTGTSTSSHQFVLWCSATSGNLPYKIGFVTPGNNWSTASEANGGYVTSFVPHDIINIDADLPNDRFLVNDELLHPLNVSSSATATLNLDIFTCNYGGSTQYKFCGKIYELKFYVGNALVVNLIPAVRDSDDVVGFYDNINDVFYPSASSTAFSTDISTITKHEPSTSIEDILNVKPATAGNIGGVIPRRALTIDLKGRMDVDLATGSTPGIITPKEGLSVNANGEVAIVKATASTMGGFKLGTGIIQAPDGTISVSAMAPHDIGAGLELEYDTEDALPIGYAYIDYISSNPSTAGASAGRARTVIDYVPNANTRIKIRASRDNTSNSTSVNYICGVRMNNNDNTYALMLVKAGSTTSTNDKSNVGLLYGSATWTTDVYSEINYVAGDIITIEASKDVLKVNDVTLKTYTPAGNPPAVKMGIFGATNNGNTPPGWTSSANPINAKIYYLKIYEGDTLVVNLIPAYRYADDAIGFYDNINDKFYTSITTYPFTTDITSLNPDPENRKLNIKAGYGLSIDPVTNELFVDGQLPEGTIIKKLTYVGDGGANTTIQFDKKPLAIITLYGQAVNNKCSAVPTVIDANVLMSLYGTGSTSQSDRGGSVCCEMSYDDSTNILTLSKGYDAGARYNISGETYQMFYLTKGHVGSGTSATNEVSVVKTFSYTGTGTATNTIQFPETPDMILKISGPLATGDITTAPIEINHPTTNADYMTIYTQHNGGSNTTNVAYGTFSFNDSTNVLTLTGSDYGDALNYSGGTYYVQYVVNETITSQTTAYAAGDAISIETIGGLQPTNYSNNDFVDSIASVNAGTIVKAADNSSFTLTASNNDCYTRGTSGQANGSYRFNVKASTKYRFAWDSANPTVHGKVYTYENGLYDAMMHEIDQYDSSYLEFTTSANTTFIQARFGVMYVGDSITYSNVRLYEFIETEDQYNEISVNTGGGLTVDQNNLLKVLCGSGLTINPSTNELETTVDLQQLANDITAIKTYLGLT